MTSIVITIEAETQHRPLRARAHTRGCTVTLDYDWNGTPRSNAQAAAKAFHTQFLRGKRLGPCKQVSQNKYKFPILA